MIAQVLFPERDCTTCDDDQKRRWGCTACLKEDGTWENPAELPVMINGEDEDWSCPRRIWKDSPSDMSFLTNAYVHYQNGFLMYGAGVADQPVRLMTMMAILSDQHERCRQEKHAAERRREEMKKSLAKEARASGGR